MLINKHAIKGLRTKAEYCIQRTGPDDPAAYLELSALQIVRICDAIETLSGVAHFVAAEDLPEAQSILYWRNESHEWCASTLSEETRLAREALRAVFVESN